MLVLFKEQGGSYLRVIREVGEVDGAAGDGLHLARPAHRAVVPHGDGVAPRPGRGGGREIWIWIWICLFVGPQAHSKNNFTHIQILNIIQ